MSEPTSEPTAEPQLGRPAHVPGGPMFWAGLALGGAMVSFGLGGVWFDRSDTHPFELALWLGGAGIVHDLILAPVFVVVAMLTGRLPARSWTPVRLGLAGSAMLTAIAWPLVRGWGRAESIPSLLPLDYGRNLLAALGMIWLVVGVVLIVRRLQDMA